MVVLAVQKKVVNIVADEIKVIVLTWNEYLLIGVQDCVAHQEDPAFEKADGDGNPLQCLGFSQILRRHLQRALQECHKLAKLDLTQEVFELLALKVSQIIALWEHLIDVQVMLPYQVLHGVCQPNFGGERLGPFKMVELLEACSLEFECIARFGGVQEMKSMNSVVIGIFEVFDRILNPSMFVCQSISHILILSKDSKYLL